MSDFIIEGRNGTLSLEPWHRGYTFQFEVSGNGQSRSITLDNILEVDRMFRQIVKGGVYRTPNQKWGNSLRSVVKGSDVKITLSTQGYVGGPFYNATAIFELDVLVDVLNNLDTTLNVNEYKAYLREEEKSKNEWLESKYGAFADEYK